MKRLITRNKAVITASVAAILLIVAGFITAKQPVPKSPIKFSHKLHVVDQGIECLDCHASVPQAGARTHLIPNHEVCANCHSDEVENQSKCGMCHIYPDDPQPVPQRAGRYEGFAHKLHTKLDCAQCHGAITEAHQNPSIPKMLDCQSCHTTMKGPLDCKICHLGVKPKPSDHQSGLWIQDHGLEAAAATTDCRQCHDQSNCDDCHQGTKVFGAKNSPHPPIGFSTISPSRTTAISALCATNRALPAPSATAE